MAATNTSVLVGNIVRSPETKVVGEKQTVLCTFSIAQNTKYKGESVAHYYDCKAWGKTGEVVAQYGKTGRKVCITARVEHERWEGEKGKGSKHVWNVREIEFLTSGEKREEGQEDPVKEAFSGKTVSASTEVPF